MRQCSFQSQIICEFCVLLQPSVYSVILPLSPLCQKTVTFHHPLHFEKQKVTWAHLMDMMALPLAQVIICQEHAN